MIILLFLSLCMSSLSIFLIKGKIHFTTLLLQLSIALFYFAMIVWTFYITKYGGEQKLIFPDEFTYAINTYRGDIFSLYTKFIISLGGIPLMRFINLFIYVFSLSFLFETMLEKNESTQICIRDLLIILFGGMASYWVFFVLKEAITIGGCCFYLAGYYKKNNPIKFSGLAVAAIARPDFTALFLGVEILFFVKQKSAPLFYATIVATCAGLIIFMNSPQSYAMKLASVSRRSQDVYKIYDNASTMTAKKDFIGYISSPVYHQTLITNVKRSFFTADSSLFGFLLSLINILGLFLIFKKIYILRNTPAAHTAFYGMLAALGGLLLTHCVHRYVNALIVPFVIYYLLLDE